MRIYADGIALNGTILTMEAGLPRASAAAWKHGRIVALGDEVDVKPLADKNTLVVDLQGKFAVPGFIDSHAHPLMKAIDEEFVNLADAQNMDELVGAIAAKAQVTPPGEWIITSAAWHDDQLEEQRLPTRVDLDQASRDHPIAVRRGTIVMVVNSLALARAAIDETTKDPEGGTIFKDPATGLPNGILDAHAKDRIEDLFPRITHERKVQILKGFLAKLSACGVTSLRDAGLMPEEMRIYQTLHQARELGIRVNMLQYVHPQWPLERGIELIRNSGAVSGFGDEMLKLGALKFACDGGFEQALMCECYLHHEGRVPANQFFGLERTEKQKMTTLILEANRHGWQVANHCVGDRAIDQVLDIYEKADAEVSVKARRWSIEHAIYPRADQIERLHGLGILVTVQPHTYMAAANMIKHWGAERAHKTYPLKTLLRKGVWIGSGSDTPTTPYNPLVAMQFWVTRRARNGVVIGAEEAISVNQALRLQTSENAYVTFEEHEKGSLRPGKYADLTLLSHDLLKVPGDELDSVRVLKTIVGGRVVFSHE